MHIIYSMLVALVCMITYRYLHSGINAMVSGIQTPWLRVGLGGFLKVLAMLTTALVAIVTILFIIMQASANEQKK